MGVFTSGGGIVVNSRGEIVLAEQSGPEWSLPQGHPEPGESPLIAAEREIARETGLGHLHYEGALPAYSAVEDGVPISAVYPFLFTTDGTTLAPDAADRHAQWVSIDRAIELLPHPADRALLDAARERIATVAARLRGTATSASGIDR